jgi:hypothetical protein
MSEVRKERTFDGRCTIFAGRGLIISDLSEETADHVLAQLTRGKAGARTVGGRQGAVSRTPRRTANSPGTRAG